jgi:hypothetical protein
VIAANEALIGFWGLARWVPYTVWVRRADAEQAMATLEAVREEQGTVDWDAQDVGEPEPGDEIARRIASGEVRGFARPARLGLAGGLLIASLIVPVWSVSLVLLLGASVLALPVLFGKKRRRTLAE